MIIAIFSQQPGNWYNGWENEKLMWVCGFGVAIASSKKWWYFTSPVNSTHCDKINNANKVFANDEPIFIKISSNKFEVSGKLEVNDFIKKSGFKIATSDQFKTIGGYILSIAGKIPVAKEKITSPEGIEFFVVDADLKKINTVIISTANYRLWCFFAYKFIDNLFFISINFSNLPEYAIINLNT